MEVLVALVLLLLLTPPNPNGRRWTTSSCWDLLPPRLLLLLAVGPPLCRTDGSGEYEEENPWTLFTRNRINIIITTKVDIVDSLG